MKRYVIATSVLVFSLYLVFPNAGGDAGDAKAAAWKPFLAADTYKELTMRSIKAIEATAQAKPKDAAEKIEVEAAILVGYTLSVKNPAEENVAKLRGAAIQAVQARVRALRRLKNWRRFPGDNRRSLPPPSRLKSRIGKPSCKNGNG